MRLAIVDCGELSSRSSVFGMGRERHVSNVHAGSRVADMVDLKAGWNWTALKLPSDPMNVEIGRRSFTAADDAIAVAVVGTQPDPTVVRATFLHPTPQALGDGYRLPTQVNVSLSYGLGVVKKCL